MSGCNSKSRVFKRGGIARIGPSAWKEGPSSLAPSGSGPSLLLLARVKEKAKGERMQVRLPGCAPACMIAPLPGMAGAGTLCIFFLLGEKLETWYLGLILVKFHFELY